ncbi:MAG: hypothetical protein RMI91_11275 [Gemmatales bacterium]|nr:hypothetical protein [Gemmatales bacterium]MDW7995224.1 hypothetical protein [Gemmatales bacterium]
MALLRWLLALVFATISCWLVGKSFRFQPPNPVQRASSSSSISWQDYITPPPPPWLPADWLAHLTTQAGLPDVPPDDASSPQMTQSLLALRQALEATPWITHARLQSAPQPLLSVQWTQAVPVHFVAQAKSSPHALWWAGENGLWLAPVSDHTLLDTVDVIPVYSVSTSFNPPQTCQPLSHCLAHAVRLALFLNPHRTLMNLASIQVIKHPIQTEILVLTRSGSHILWETLDTPSAGAVSDTEKLERLLEYIRLWQSLDKPAGPYFFDNRFPHTLFRKPLK